jgi:hypothetical protein
LNSEIEKTEGMAKEGKDAVAAPMAWYFFLENLKTIFDNIWQYKDNTEFAKVVMPLPMWHIRTVFIGGELSCLV